MRIFLTIIVYIVSYNQIIFSLFTKLEDWQVNVLILNDVQTTYGEINKSNTD